MASSARGSSRKWAVDFGGEGSGFTGRAPNDPPGYGRGGEQDADSSTSTKRKDAEVTMKQKKAWEAATAPMKQILMMGFMMWMAGSTVHIFSIMITATAIWQPLQAIRGAPALFKRFKDPKVDTFSCQAVYILFNLAAFGIGLFKLNTLGLLPTSASDWISDAVPQALEISGGGIPLSLY